MATKKQSSINRARKGLLSDFTRDDGNANRGTKRGRKAIAASLEKNGAGRSLLADRNGRLIAGNHVHQSAEEAGKEDVLIIPIDGSRLVVLQRMDLELGGGGAAREMSIDDNRTAELNLNWDSEALMKGPRPKVMFSVREWAKVAAASGAPETPVKDSDQRASAKVRIVHLFFSPETNDQFEGWCEALAAEYGTENVTDTVYEAVRQVFEALGAEPIQQPPAKEKK